MSYFLTTAETAAALGVSDSSVRRWIKEGRLPEPGWTSLGRRRVRAFSSEWIDRARATLEIYNDVDTSIQVFLSNDSSGEILARQLKQQLEENGAQVFLPSEALPKGERALIGIETALSAAQVLVFIVTRGISRWLSYEADSAVRRAKTGDALVIPLIGPGASLDDVPVALQSFQGLRVSDLGELHAAAIAIIRAGTSLRDQGRSSSAPRLPDFYVETGFVRDTIAAIERAAPGQVVWLSGPAGSGKSVAAAATARLTSSRFASTLWFDGRQLGELRPTAVEGTWPDRSPRLIVVDGVSPRGDTASVLNLFKQDVILVTSEGEPPSALRSYHMLTSRFSRAEAQDLIATSIDRSRSGAAAEVPEDLLSIGDNSPLFAALVGSDIVAARQSLKSQTFLRDLSPVQDRLLDVLTWAGPIPLPREMFLDSYVDPFLGASLSDSLAALTELRARGLVVEVNGRLSIAVSRNRAGNSVAGLEMLSRGVSRMRGEDWIDPLDSYELAGLAD